MKFQLVAFEISISLGLFEQYKHLDGYISAKSSIFAANSLPVCRAFSNVRNVRATKSNHTS